MSVSVTIPLRGLGNCLQLTSEQVEMNFTYTLYECAKVYDINVVKRFVVIGDQTRTCGADGEWTGSAPECQSMLLHITLSYTLLHLPEDSTRNNQAGTFVPNESCG